ncbi:MAG: right-handed parallel beta-helix repeat-containing protein [Planctomycetes bacterium]|nr:right-handed parallel beta-helix repeat-containing protein [Planctomycetota bacterium]
MRSCLRIVTVGAATLAAFTFIRGGHASDVHFVDADAPPGGDGSSWAQAFDDLHDGLAAAAADDSVWVAVGTYVPAPPGGSRAAAFTIPGGVSVYGGFFGDESSPEERELGAFPSVLSGDLNGDDGPGFAENGDNAFHVVIAGGDPAPALLDGFTVRGGNASGALSWGAGLYVDVGSITLRGCTFTHNFATGGGGGVYASNGALTLDGCVFLENLVPTTHGGGARVVDAASVIVVGTRFQGNESDIGAGISVIGADSLTITDSQFLGNYSEASGGGVFAFEVDATEISGCEFRDNDGGFTGGAMIHGGTTISISNTVFASNTASSIAGAFGTSAALTMVNCVFSRNDSFAQGGAAVLAGPSADLANCTFANNDGGAILTELNTGSVVVRNTIIWGNTGEPFRGPETPDVAYCDVEGGWRGRTTSTPTRCSCSREPTMSTCPSARRRSTSATTARCRPA